MKTRTLRKIHRHLGLVIGVQLLFWTTSGLIFSWNSIESVRGENLIRSQEPRNLNLEEVKSLSEILESRALTMSDVSANRGIVTTRRNSQWRMFDFFWILHTMDYLGRDNFNHWLLRGMSIFGVITVLSGFGLGLTTTCFYRRKRRKRDKNDDS